MHCRGIGYNVHKTFDVPSESNEIDWMSVLSKLVA